MDEMRKGLDFSTQTLHQATRGEKTMILGRDSGNRVQDPGKERETRGKRKYKDECSLTAI